MPLFVFNVPEYLPLPGAYTVRAWPGTLDYNLRIREGEDVFFSLIVSLPGDCPEDDLPDEGDAEEEYDDDDEGASGIYGVESEGLPCTGNPLGELEEALGDEELGRLRPRSRHDENVRRLRQGNLRRLNPPVRWRT